MSSLRSDHNPYMRRPDRPNKLRRSAVHDYTAPAPYMLTLRKAPETPLLSRIEGDLAAPSVALTAAGQAFVDAIGEWEAKFPQIRIYAYAVMPDHIHLALRVREPLPAGLSRVVAWLMGAATRRFGSSTPFFARGFNDRIGYSKEIFERQIAYVRDNPRRLLLKRMFKDFFRRRWQIKIDDEEFVAIGNIQLLRNPEILQVRFSRKYSEEEFQGYVRLWKRCVFNGGALVSPFIHPREREMKDFAAGNGGCYIRICENGFDDRFAPTGVEFELMAEGRLLLIAPVIHDTRKQVMTRSHAMEMNALSRKIANGAVRLAISGGR